MPASPRYLLSTGTFSQNWSNAGLITTNDDWNGVPAIAGYRGDDITTAVGVDPRTLTSASGSAVVLDVNANQTNPVSFSTGGVTEFALADPTIALTGSGTADAPSIVFYLDATGRQDVRFQCNLRDIEAGTDDAVQQVAVQYRVGGGNWVNVAYVADATTGTTATQVTAIDVTLPSDANNAADLEIRVITTNASGNDEWVGVDDIVISSAAPPLSPGVLAFNAASTDVSVLEGNAGTTPITFTVGRTGGSQGAVSATWTATLGTASADDFASGQVFTGTVNFADGQSSATITLNVQGDTLGEGNETFTVALSAPTGGATLGTAVSANGTITNDDIATVTIAQIQGVGHTSAYVGQSVITTGIVTAVDTNGFWIQMATGDGNAQTSDGIFVFTSSAPPAAAVVGNEVNVSGTVTEFQSSATTGLTVTEITSPTVALVTAGNPLPAAILFGTGGVNPPTANYDDDGLTSYDPANDAIDFYEQFEGMRVTIDAPRVVSNTNSFGETWVVASNGANATGNAARGGITISNGDLNPERIQIDQDTGIFSGYTPNHTVGDRLASVNGIFNYAFDSYEVLVTSAVTVTNDVTLGDETAGFSGDLTHLTIATYNMENLDSSDNKYGLLADDIVLNLLAPDIIAAQEIQDADGAGSGANLSGVPTAQGLIDALATRGYTYAYVEIAPTTANSTGGEPNGNIRNGYFYRTDRVQYVANSAQLITGSAYTGSRNPLVADFTFNGLTIELVNMHSTSRGGSEPLFGDNQPPVNAGEAARNNQAATARAFVNSQLATNPNANIVVLGDFNGFYFETSLQNLTNGGVLTNLNSLLPVEERYSYLFDGNLQQLDNIMVTGGLVQGAVYDAVHLNAESASATRPTDHDPQVARLVLVPQFNGGSGDDTYTAPSANPYQIYGNDGNDTLTGNAVADLIVGGNGNDILDGAGGNDSIIGGSGNDRLIGGTGTNELQGGDGDDTYVVTNAADSVIEAALAGLDTVETTVAAYVLGTNVENLSFTNAVAHVGYGNGLDNVLTGGTGFDALIGGAGNDRLIGGSGTANELQGGIGNDTYVLAAAGDSAIEAGGEGTDTVETALGSMALAANVENLTYTGSGSFIGTGNGLNNTILGGIGADTLGGGAGNDTLSGGSGAANELQGGDGDDIYVVQVAGDTVIELAGGGNDIVATNLTSYTLAAEVEGLTYTGAAAFTGVGNAGNNGLSGGSGNDFLSGADGNDTLIGKAGNDLLFGGAGADNFYFAGDEGASFDRIIDFTSGTDKVQLSTIGFVHTATVDYVAGAAATSANSTFLYDTSTGLLSYDADGNGAGAAVLLAQLNTGLTLTVSDFAFV